VVLGCLYCRGDRLQRLRTHIAPAKFEGCKESDVAMVATLFREGGVQALAASRMIVDPRHSLPPADAARGAGTDMIFMGDGADQLFNHPPLESPVGFCAAFKYVARLPWPAFSLDLASRETDPRGLLAWP
jgi:hypothetical protein